MIPCCDIDIGPGGSKPRASGDDPSSEDEADAFIS